MNSEFLNGFKKVDAKKYELKSTVKLDDAEFCEFRFKGYKQNAKELRNYCEKNNIEITKIIPVGDEYEEVRVIAFANTTNLVEMFPELKATGFAEFFGTMCEAKTLYSDCGYSVFTHESFGGYFDGNDEAGNGRWTWEYDIIEGFDSIKHFSVDGWSATYSYKYPFTEMWNNDSYVLKYEGEFYIKQNADAEDFEVIDGKLISYNGEAKDVIIPVGVTDIGNAFMKNGLIESVVIPSSVKSISWNAFEDCQNLKKVVIQEGVEKIGSSAFENCTSLKEVVVPDSIINIWPRAFCGCTGLDFGTFHIPENDKTGECGINHYNFKGCKNVPDIIFNKDKTILLSYSPELKDETYCVPETVKIIGSSAFEGDIFNESCLKEIVLSDSIEEICSDAFHDCKNLKKINLPSKIKEIKRSTFSWCTSLKSINIPIDVEKIGEGAFYNCANIEKIEFNNKLKSIGSSAFSGCVSLNNIDLPDNVETVGNMAFRNCDGIVEFKMPPKVTVLPEELFENCTSLKRVILNDDVKEIKRSAFKNCWSLIEINIPTKLKKIGVSAFSGCDELQLGVIPEHVKMSKNSLPKR